MRMIELNVTGMHCKSCEMLLREDLGEIPGVSGVRADHVAGIVSFNGSESVLPQVKAVIEKNGYKVG
ncbi:heavy-metal-associated domain-containing protein [Candidatus Micrarchaeota archaeon]|nr:heavy-metal-associated domain-containing protein [Candidatus Micrarchaeota archaeon]